MASGIRCGCRVRGRAGEVRLASHEHPTARRESWTRGSFRKVLLGISCRDYEAAVEAVPGAIGLSKSTVSRSSSRHRLRSCRSFQSGDLSPYDVALVLDGSISGGRRDGGRARRRSMGQGSSRVRPMDTQERGRYPVLSVFPVYRNSICRPGALVVIDGAKGLQRGHPGGLPGPAPSSKANGTNGRTWIPHCCAGQRLALARSAPISDPTTWWCRPGVEDAVAGQRSEPVRSGQSRRGARRDPHPPSARRLSLDRQVAQDHQRARVRERPDRAALRPRGPPGRTFGPETQDRWPATALPRDRASAPEAVRLPAPPAPADRQRQATTSGSACSNLSTCYAGRLRRGRSSFN